MFCSSNNKINARKRISSNLTLYTVAFLFYIGHNTIKENVPQDVHFSSIFVLIQNDTVQSIALNIKYGMGINIYSRLILHNIYVKN